MAPNDREATTQRASYRREKATIILDHALEEVGEEKEPVIAYVLLAAELPLAAALPLLLLPLVALGTDGLTNLSSKSWLPSYRAAAQMV